MISWIFLMRAFFSRHLTVFAKMSVKYSNILNTKIAKVFFMCISGRNNLVKVFYIHKISYIPSLLVPFPFFQFPFRTILQQMNFLRYNGVQFTALEKKKERLKKDLNSDVKIFEFKLKTKSMKTFSYKGKWLSNHKRNFP